MVIAESFRLTILLVDMERNKGCFPFRFLHRFSPDSDFDRPQGAAAGAGAGAGAGAAAAAAAESATKRPQRTNARRSFGDGPAAAGGGGGGGGSLSTRPTPAAAIVGQRGERFIILKRQGPVGHFQFVERVDDNRAVFSREDLPGVVKTLWGL